MRLSKEFFISVTVFLNSFLHIVRTFNLFIIIILHNLIIPEIVVMSESGLYTALALQSAFACLLACLCYFLLKAEHDLLGNKNLGKQVFRVGLYVNLARTEAVFNIC